MDRLGRIRAFILLIVALFVLDSSPALAQRSHSSGGRTHSSSGHSKSKSEKKSKDEGDKTVHVRGYTKKDGTYVAPHDRRAPDIARTSSSSAHSSSSTSNAHLRCNDCDRDSHGRIVRSRDAKKAFMKATGFPKGRPGYVVDHIIPLACGGADLPSNMQWQTVEAAKAKDRMERVGCR